ncbi:hypothetical protein ACWDAZ_32200, partial [Streptomyces sp. NPDC001215]
VASVRAAALVAGLSAAMVREEAAVGRTPGGGDPRPALVPHLGDAISLFTRRTPPVGYGGVRVTGPGAEPGRRRRGTWTDGGRG